MGRLQAAQTALDDALAPYLMQRLLHPLEEGTVAQQGGKLEQQWRLLSLKSKSETQRGNPATQPSGNHALSTPESRLEKIAVRIAEAVAGAEAAAAGMR